MLSVGMYFEKEKGIISFDLVEFRSSETVKEVEVKNALRSATEKPYTLGGQPDVMPGVVEREKRETRVERNNEGKETHPRPNRSSVLQFNDKTSL